MTLCQPIFHASLRTFPRPSCFLKVQAYLHVMDHDSSSVHTSASYADLMGANSSRGTAIQVLLSVVLGTGAFLTFCVLRPRWKELYAARKRQKDEAAALPELPDTMFGWIPILWRIDEKELLASAGLDAFAFLAFLKMAIKFLAISLFFALVVFEPVHRSYPDEVAPGRNETNNATEVLQYKLPDMESFTSGNSSDGHPKFENHFNSDFMWMYLIFAYVFSALLIYLVVKETTRISGLRQEYLGNQSTITDRTFLLSGIPHYLRSEDKIKKFVEDLEIGKVDSVILCCNWGSLDKLMDERKKVLRKLEEAYIELSKKKGHEESRGEVSFSHTSAQNEDEEEDDDANEASNLLGNVGRDSLQTNEHDRPISTVRHGPLKLQSTEVDAIHHYRTQLRTFDNEIKALREAYFEPRPLAFVTMDSVASCQMAQQAVLDPLPLQLLARPSPAPVEVVWRNTYLSRPHRMARSWTITIIISILTLFWSLLLVPVAGALNLETVGKVFPNLADFLYSHKTIKTLFQIQLPTLVVSLLNAAVPYLYDWLSNHQGSISQADVELSVVSKNFFFTFFNFFVVFTLLGTFSNFLEFYSQFGKSLNDAAHITKLLASSLQRLLTFYQNYIILQGIGLYPVRLLEAGSMLLTPLYSVVAKTPRDHAEVAQAPVFSYGFYLPPTLLVFVICIVYSVLRSSWKIILTGLIYFIAAFFVHKYQLLYAMDHQHHSTGRGWIMMCNRVFVGIVLFQLTLAGQLAFGGALKRSTGIIPLLILTVWAAFKYNRTFQPLFHFIALRSIKRGMHGQEVEDDVFAANVAIWRDESETHHRETVDESRERGLRYINPSLISPLERVWTADGDESNESEGESV